jgi:predicted O-linked N-acetylglucosamine transferase (SPINDLY family)
MLNWLKKTLTVSENAAQPKDAGAPGDGSPAKAVAPNEYVSHKKRGNEFLAQGKLEDAAESYRQAVAADPGRAEGFLNLGYVLRELGLLDEAEHNLKRALLIDPAMADACYLLGGIAQERGNLAEAIGHYSKTLELKPDFEMVYGELCQLLFQSGKKDEARKVIEQGLARYPGSAEFHCFLGNLYVDEKKYDLAIPCYQQALLIQPDYVAVHNLLGNAFSDQGELDKAVASYRKALALDPDSVEANNNLGASLQSMGNFGEAIACYLKVLALKPDSVEANNNLGSVFKKQGDLEQAQSYYRQALALDPGCVDAYNNLSSLFHDRGDLDEAEACYRKALALTPDNADIHNNLGTLFQARDDLDRAAACFRKALSLNPECVDAHNNLGVVLKKQGRLNEAVACYRSALALRQDLPEIYNNFGNVLKDQGKLESAEDCFRKALALKPDDADTHNNLGALLQDRLNLDDAASCYRKALALRPDFSLAHNNLGVIYQEQNKLKDALACYRQAVKFDPGFHMARANLLHVKQHVCDWDDFAALCEEVRRSVRELPPSAGNLIPPFSFLAIPGSTPEEQKLCARNWAQSKTGHLTALREEMGFAFKREPGQKLHIGYFSADFRNHAVAHLMAEIFELHDRKRFRISAYSFGPDDGSAMRKRLEKSFDQFVDIWDVTHENAARKIYDDRVDILVNLTGYTKYARNAIVALHPAPLQVNYLGYPGTMGAGFMDHLIADRFIIPPERQKHYAEKVACLPDCYLPRDSSCRRLAAPSRKECGLPEEGFVFCSFNVSYKITPDIFDIWCRLLKAVPGSVLWLPSSNPDAESNLSREAKIRGVDPARIIRASRLNSTDEHLARIQCADLFLDTTPYNAHTTCSDALWMGLPLVTCVGETFPSRVAGSLLTAIGAPELITYSLEDYYALALELATDKNRYRDIRNKITANRESAPMFDSKKFTRDLESIYLQMWEAYVMP